VNAPVRFNSVACYVVQHDHNPTMFLDCQSPTGDPTGWWTHDIEKAYRFASQGDALRWLNNWRNGKGYVLPCIMHRGRPRVA